MNQVVSTPSSSSSSPQFPIVGVGASAGGLEAFTHLLHCLSPETGLGFVLIQHLDPTHPSLLSEALAKATAMPVHQAADGMRVEANHVYVIAPNSEIALHDGRLVLSTRQSAGHGPHLPVDVFLRSLAADLGCHAIGVVLSGSASDGTDGLRAIRAEDGVTFAQDPRSAKFAGMPQSAIDAGVVDHCMDIPQLADELLRLSRNPYEQPQVTGATDGDQQVRAEIFARVRRSIGVELGELKPSTVARRLARRLALRNVLDLPAYLKLLDAEPEEIRALYEDMLIHVTSFFRDPEVFESLGSHVFPEILKYKPEGGTVRMWVVGCSTGEEVYSLAMAWLDFVGEALAAHPIQIFGSDVSQVAIQKARSGVYDDGALSALSDERRSRYFAKLTSGARIAKSVRELCIFVRHDVVRDPPFSKLDLVSCRNVLIYFDQALQKKVLPTLHYCLNQSGFLVLGRSENISGLGQLFSTADKANKIFMRSPVASNLRFAPRVDPDGRSARLSGRGRERLEHDGTLLSKHFDRLLLARYCPPAVLVKDNLEVLLFRGQTGPYLQAAAGQPQNNLVGMAPGGLISAVRSALAQAKQEAAVVTRPDVEIEHDGSTKTCDVVVMPFSGLPDSRESLFIVSFEDAEQRAKQGPKSRRVSEAPRTESDERRRSARLEHELSATREYLQTLIAEHDRANDELGASNEELMSGNEELQSTNEELETAKEELQSINEELTTLNDELHRRNQEITGVNSDLLNFSLTVDIPLLMLDRQRCIRRFTPKARSILNVLPGDVGRPIDDIKLNILVPDLSRQITEVVETTVVKETEVQDGSGHWYRMQVRPYTTPEGATDGVVLSLMDIDDLKQLVASAQQARIEAERANVMKDEFLATLSHELRTPLSSMLLNAQRLRDGDVVDPADLQRAGEALERAARTQAKLIDDLLDVSRIVAGKLTLDLGPVDLCGIVRSVIDGMSASIEQKALAFRVQLDPALGEVWADRVRVQQVVSNLLNNAIKFTPHAGYVTVSVDAVDGFARLRVADTGIGIDPAFVPNVFARFFQSDSSITRKYGGLGLGLALVRHLVELQGGSVRAESPGVDKGATFTVTFPLTRASQAPAPERVTATPRVDVLDRTGREPRYAELKDLRILFIDDDLRTREAVFEVLRLTGARVELADSAAEGMAAVDSFKPQVILCDIAMPGEDGYTFIRKLRARAPGDSSQIPALAFTALAAQDDKCRALAAGFQLHLAKPIDIDRLRDAVAELAKLAKGTMPS